MVAAIKSRVDAGAAVRVRLREEEEYRERIAAIRQTVKASLDDPRPNLSGEEVEQYFEAHFRKA